MDHYSTFEIAKKFAKWKNESLYVQIVEKPSMFKLLGELKGKNVIEFGCGTGNYTKNLAEKAEKVVGVDISSCMIQLADEISKLPNITYYVRDCTQNLNLGTFDLAVSVFLLCHASTKEILKKFLSSMYHSLKSGGICCGITHNVYLKSNEFHHLSKYNISMKAVDEDFKTSNEIIVEFLDSKTSETMITVSDYHYESEVVENTFKEVGFINFKWLKYTLNQEFNEYKEFLTDYLNYSDGILYYAEKP